jgi:hypothetical protein
MFQALKFKRFLASVCCESSEDKASGVACAGCAGWAGCEITFNEDKENPFDA